MSKPNFRIPLYASLAVFLLTTFSLHHAFAGDPGLVSFFGARLENPSAGESPAPAGFKLSELEKERRIVWDSWVEANNSYPEEKLPALAPMQDAQAQKWELTDEDPMPFYWINKGDMPQAGYPLFINLHGSGPKEREWEAAQRLSDSYDDAPSVYFIPQIPNHTRYRWWFIPEQLAWEKLIRLAMVSGTIDPDRIYFLGISEGGYGSQRLGAFYADYLAGAGPMAGGEPLDNAPPLNYRNIAFAFETGENDEGFGRNMYTRMAKAAFDNLAMDNPGSFIHNINLQKDKGHRVDYTLVTPWLKQYSRNPHPKTVSWVNYPMHDRYRSGFYNLAVTEPFDVSPGTPTDRTIFNMEIDGNTVTLKANTFDTATRQFGEISHGKLIVYLSPELVDLSKPVTLVVNGNTCFKGKVKTDRRHLIESCLIFFDPMRLYPAAIEIDFTTLAGN